MEAHNPLTGGVEREQTQTKTDASRIADATPTRQPLSEIAPVRGAALHQRVDSGTGACEPPKKVRGPKSDRQSLATSAATGAEETIHSRSVQMGSERLGVVAKMDLVEVRQVPNHSTVQGPGIE